MLTIRLARGGAKKRPFYHIVVAEKTSPRDGRFIERLGFSNPLAAGQAEPLRLNLARYEHWREVGAEPSATVMRLARTAKRKQEAAAQKAATQEIAAQETAAARSGGARNCGARNCGARNCGTRNCGARSDRKPPDKKRQNKKTPPTATKATASLATDKIIIGHFGSPFGVCGWLHIHSHSGRRDTFLQNSVWWCARPDGPWQKINIAQIRPQGARLTAKIAGVDDREQASFWRHANIAVQRADLPPLTAEDEYYWCDLVGLQAQNTGGEILGVVKKLLSSGATGHPLHRRGGRQKRYFGAFCRAHRQPRRP